MTLNIFLINALTIIGTIAFAISGTLSAQQKQMDLFGMIVVANITAVGGGTIRDVLLGHQPFWIQDSSCLLIATGAAVLTLFINRSSKPFLNLLYVMDAIGLAFFVVVGIGIGVVSHISPLIASIMGVLTGIGGGILRDMLCGEVPLVLHKEIYATAAIAGAIVYFAMLHWQVTESLAITLSMLTILTLRLAAIYWHWSLPKKLTLGE